MGKLKYILGSGAASAALALGMALPVAAQQTTDCTGDDVSTNICPNVNIDNSRTRITELEQCSAIIDSDVTQVQANTAVNTQANVGAGTGTGVGGPGTGAGVGVVGDGAGTGTGGDGTGVGSNEQSNTGGATATGNQTGGVWFSPDCSTTNNVTNNPVRDVVHTREVVVHQRSNAVAHGHGGAVLSASTTQVEAPVGGVGAGAGGAVSSIAGSLAGIGGSLASLGYGLVQFRKRD